MGWAIDEISAQSKRAAQISIFPPPRENSTYLDARKPLVLK